MYARTQLKKAYSFAKELASPAFPIRMDGYFRSLSRVEAGDAIALPSPARKQATGLSCRSQLNLT
ncbi:MAG: hypothetical protein GX352_05590 [Clostridiales bacterium]|nr:hypothetical protein [Clostridiales bacterium]